MRAVTPPAADTDQAPGSRAGARERLRGTLIVNPRSSGLTARREREVVRVLSEYLQLEVVRTERGGHAIELAREAEAHSDIILACGGDGTANEVINGMSLGTGTADDAPLLAVVPAGGTNVLARSLDIPNDPIKASGQLATAIAGRRSRSINLGVMDERRFLFSAGVGLDAGVVKRITEKRTGRRPGDIAHIAALAGIFAYERMTLDEKMTVTFGESDDSETIRASLLTVCNQAPLSYVGRLRMDVLPAASLDAGLSVMAPGRTSAAFATRYLLGSIGLFGKRRISPERVNVRDDVHHMTAVCDEPEPCQVDGEYLGERTHFAFSVLTDTVRLVY